MVGRRNRIAGLFIALYATLSVVYLFASQHDESRFVSILIYCMWISGPPAWLIHGVANVDIYVALTAVIFALGYLTLRLWGRSGSAYWLVAIATGLLWLFFGFAAYAPAF